ncbi:MAG: hypothetical protein KJ067_21895, partial [Vicinamibacteria bacterium]|nr:hypothetical protein [Vicinamibacteria bacterium]
ETRNEFAAVRGELAETREDLSALRGEARNEFAAVRGELATTRDQLLERFDATRTELGERIDSLEQRIERMDRPGSVH